MLDKLFFLVLVFNGTGLFAFLAPQIGVSIGDVSSTLLILQGWYLFARRRYLGVLLKQTDIIWWVFLLFIWPLSTLLYAPFVDFRDVGLRLLHVTLLLGAVIYAMANGVSSMYRLISASLVITIVGLVLSMITPQYFEATAYLADAKLGGRAYGFLLQPNRLAASMNLLFMCWYALWKGKRRLVAPAMIVGFAGFVLLTGSRFGILTTGIMVFFMVLSTYNRLVVNGRFLLRVVVLILSISGGVLVARYQISRVQYTDSQTSDLLRRLENLLSFRLTDEGVREDVSVQLRLAAQKTYMSMIREKPLLGYGLGASTYYQNTGRVFLAPHNDALLSAFEFGLLYPLTFVFLMLKFYLKPTRHLVARVLKTSAGIQFLAVVMFLFTLSGLLIENRMFYIVFGVFFAAMYCPGYVFRFGENTRETVGLRDLGYGPTWRDYPRGIRWPTVMRPRW